MLGLKVVDARGRLRRSAQKDVMRRQAWSGTFGSKSGSARKHKEEKTFRPENISKFAVSGRKSFRPAERVRSHFTFP